MCTFWESGWRLSSRFLIAPILQPVALYDIQVPTQGPPDDPSPSGNDIDHLYHSAQESERIRAHWDDLISAWEPLLPSNDFGRPEWDR